MVDPRTAAVGVESIIGASSSHWDGEGTPFNPWTDAILFSQTPDGEVFAVRQDGEGVVLFWFLAGPSASPVDIQNRYFNTSDPLPTKVTILGPSVPIDGQTILATNAFDYSARVAAHVLSRASAELTLSPKAQNLDSSLSGTAVASAAGFGLVLATPEGDGGRSPSVIHIIAPSCPE
jgi:hypothetical protein